MDIEVIATSAVKASLSITDYLSPYINERDKEPIWDGNIYVFSNKNKSNKSCNGRVPVQVKGKKVDDLSAETIKYPVQTDNLKKYLNDNGIIFFVVYITDNGDTKIYYNSLLPFKIKQLLTNSKDNDSISTEFSIFPTDNTEKVDLFLNFLRDRDQQKIITSMNLVTIDELAKMGQLKNLSFSFTSSRTDLNSPIDYLFTHNTYLYATVPLGIKIPVDLMSEMVYAEKTLSRPVSSNGTHYYDGYNVIHKKDIDEVHLGKSIVFRLGEAFSIKYNLNGTLNQRITDIAFVIDIFESGFINIDGTDIPTKMNNPTEIPGLRLNELKKLLVYLKNVQIALEKAGVKDDLDYDALSKENEADIKTLIDNFIYSKEISLEIPDVPLFGKMTIANLSILLIVEEQETGLYRFSNFFDKHISIRAIDKDKGDFDTSQFVILNKDNFLGLSNIDYDVMYKDIISIEGDNRYYTQITNLLLDMLLAYDESKPNNLELLKAAHRIAEWLSKSNTEKSDVPIMLLNLLQTVKRSRPLSDDELGQLYSLIENGNITESVLTGTYILLEDSVGTKFHYNKMSPEEQTAFIKYPIYNLWKRN